MADQLEPAGAAAPAGPADETPLIFCWGCGVEPGQFHRSTCFDVYGRWWRWAWLAALLAAWITSPTY